MSRSVWCCRFELAQSLNGPFQTYLARRCPYGVASNRGEIDEFRPYQIDGDRKRTSLRRWSVPNLVAIHVAVPRCAAMHQLVAQNIEAIEEDRENHDRIVLAQCVIDGSPVALSFSAQSAYPGTPF